MHQLPETGYLRLPQIIGNPKAVPPIPPLIPVGKSTWWAGVKSGRYPKPVRTLGERITAWRVEDIRALIEHCSASVEAGVLPDT
jgi:prophage regulatory protein